MDYNFEFSGFLDGKYIKPSEYTVYDGKRLDKLKIDAVLRNMEDFNKLIDFLHIHKHCFDKPNN